jgi:hypothetical protein
MLFVDGIGIGEADAEKNPFIKNGFKTFTEIWGEIPHLKNSYLVKNNFYLFPVDASLGVEGLPQSGTGQTALFCGVNASSLIGKHFGPFPYSSLIPVIRDKNIFVELKRIKKKVCFANAYPKIFFDYLKKGKSRLSVTSLSARFSGMRLNTVTDVRRGKALTAEITNLRWNKKLGYKLKVIKASTAARRLLRIAAQNHFTLYEYFLTDHLGHGRAQDEASYIFSTLDEFLLTIFKEADYKTTTVILCSDHGNLEDLSVKSHTLNPALGIAAGKFAERIAENVKNISQFKSEIIRILK